MKHLEFSGRIACPDKDRWGQTIVPPAVTEALDAFTASLAAAGFTDAVKIDLVAPDGRKKAAAIETPAAPIVQAVTAAPEPVNTPVVETGRHHRAAAE
jgi:hypothetical protein